MHNKRVLEPKSPPVANLMAFFFMLGNYGVVKIDKLCNRGNGRRLGKTRKTFPQEKVRETFRKSIFNLQGEENYVKSEMRQTMAGAFRAFPFENLGQRRGLARCAI